jgi:hypothetical protein
VHGGDACLPPEPLAQAVGSGLGEQERLGPGDVLQAREVGAQVGLGMQIDVEAADVVAVEIEIFGRREIDVGQEAVGRALLAGVVEILKKAFDAALAVPADHRGRNLVADREHQHGRMRRQRSHGCGDLLADAPGQLPVAEKSDVLRPWHADHDAQAVPLRRVEEGHVGHGVDANRVEARLGHQAEVLFDLMRCRVLSAARIRRERSVGHAFDQEAAAIDLEELTVHARGGGRNGDHGVGR